MYAIKLDGNIATGYKDNPDVPPLAPVSIVLTGRYASEEAARKMIERMIVANHSSIKKSVVEVL